MVLDGRLGGALRLTIYHRRQDSRGQEQAETIRHRHSQSHEERFAGKLVEFKNQKELVARTGIAPVFQP
jgi:hypothetical protein